MYCTNKIYKIFVLFLSVFIQGEWKFVTFIEPSDNRTLDFLSPHGIRKSVVINLNDAIILF